MKTAHFTVHASSAQAADWNRAAAGEGYPSTGSWIADAVDRYLKLRVRMGRPLPLAWRRGHFSVRLAGGELVTVNGHMSVPFGSFSGTEEGPATYCGLHRHVLVYVPDSRVIATLKSFRQCKALAAEIAPALLKGELPDPAPVIGRHIRDAV